MRHTDRAEFNESMRDAAEAVGQGSPYTDGALDLMFAALGEFSLDAVKQALVDHLNSPDGKWRPNASYIRAQIVRRAGAGWISADEAWARIPKPAGIAKHYKEGRDGKQKLDWVDYRGAAWPAALLNQVTTEALAVAGPLLEAGEENAARMAFRAAYNRLVEQETAAGRPPKYRAAGGTHEEQQTLLIAAAEQGLLPAPPAAPALPAPTGEGRARFKLEMSKLQMKSLPPPGADDD